MPDDLPAPEAAPNLGSVMSELKVSGHMMRLEPGLFCIVQTPSAAADPATGLPGVRVSAAPGIMIRPDTLQIASFRPDGWLAGSGDAALVRVIGAPQHVMVTVYQAANAQDGAPSVQVLRLLDPGAGARAPGAAAGMIASEHAGTVSGQAPLPVDIVAHVQTLGDVGGHLGNWLGVPGSQRWIEGFALAPFGGVPADEVEYQVVLGRGWSSPWVEGGQFCGSRGMALPILGYRVRLRGKAAETMTCTYAACFIDGMRSGPVGEGEACEADSLAALEALVIAIHPRGEPHAIVMPGAAAATADATLEPAPGGATRGGSRRPRAA